MNTETITNCLNCQTHLQGLTFCGFCGQRNIHRRLVWSSLVEDLNVQIFELNLPWLKIIRDLTLRPGKVCSDYADGHRIVYVNPLRYVFYILAIFVIVFNLNGPLDPGEVRFGWFAQSYYDLLPAILRFTLTNIPVYMLLLSPVAILLFKLIFWRSGRNWVEITCFVLFMIGHGALLISLLSFIEVLYV